MALGWAITKWLKYPAWFTPALAFNNTTSLPLVLIQSLDSTGILASLLKDENDSTKEAIARAKSFFLVCSLVCNALTFSLGPKLLDGEEAPESKEGDGDDDAAKQNDYPSARPAGQDDAAERGQGGDGPDDAEDATEQTSLLPHVVNHHINRASDVGRRQSSKVWERLPRWLQQLLEFLHNFLVAPVIGAIFGCLIGLSPPLRRIFFNSTNDGGVLTAWFTNSIKNVGDLFAALQLVVVGCKLSTSLRRMKEDKDSGTVAWGPMLTAFAVRFLLWPVYVIPSCVRNGSTDVASPRIRADHALYRISIPVIWAVATKTSLLGNDPMLWFCLMLMPTGPPAIKLTALADVNGSSEHEKMSIAKFLTVGCSHISFHPPFAPADLASTSHCHPPLCVHAQALA